MGTTKTRQSDRRRLAPSNNPNFGLIQRDGSRVINERCSCGAMRSEHDGLIGHGPYFGTGCAKFTWQEFVTVAAAK